MPPNQQPTPAEEYQLARAELLTKEKALTHDLQTLASLRRALPRVHIPSPRRFKFDTPSGEKTLPDLFAGRKQLILYHFMLSPGSHDGCVGCSFCMDHIADVRHLRSRETSFVAVATAPVDEIKAYKERMGWEFPFYSCEKTCRAWREAEEQGETVTWKPGNGFFGLAVFVKEGGEVYHTYETTDRGMEILLSTYHLLDMTPLGRQEVGNGMGGFRRHDEY
ncbi:DUF899-domain-containing protein [Aspergillus steynii IBT 23096]|uniref:DUF899-domain-containing protein n=1 Tax=Aspergillus steynii IBT 23096 TaxID=1392250 RepID=A0A2I2FVC5_9EURO|nr:DUF899-domain-containing protein [Aspergillus steynii IBT 23096]PLB44585.1 DUF899-domain-containing protein [Aspergillus steynii IBT 23096]